MALPSLRPRLLLTAVVAFAAGIASLQAAAWEKNFVSLAPGKFPQPRPVNVRYAFGWGGFTAANVDVRFQKLKNGQFQFEATGATVGLARALWSYDLVHTARANAETLRPVAVKEVETLRTKQKTTELTFTSSGVTSVREDRKPDGVTTKTRQFDFPDVLSINSALLLLRSQTMTEGAAYRVVVYPATSAYLCTVTVQGRERLSVATGTHQAIKLDVQLSKIDEQRELQPHKKFRGATVWLSDDADRLVLRIETQVFIGKVFAELQSMQFDNPKP